MRPSPTATASDLRAAVLLAAGLTVVRLVALFRTPLELYPDEAQYWLWSRTLDFGYYSKPPMIAWAIWATTAIGGDAEAWVRLSACLFQFGATVVVFLIGRRLYDGAVGLAAAALYGLMPGIQLSALVAATDAPLLFFLGLAVLAYVALLQADDPRRRLPIAVGVGATLGMAFLSKYAAIYGVIGIAVHAIASPAAGRAWDVRSVAAAVVALVAVLAPNLAWNAAHDFATFQHTASNAAWSGVQLFNLAEAGMFLLSQFGVFGPIPAGVLIAGVGLAVARKRLSPADLTLLCFTVPPLAIVTCQAFISRANANWSGAAYLTGVILAAAWLLRWRAGGWLMAALALQGAVAIFFLAAVISPALADRVGLANGLKRARGWEQTADMILDRAFRERDLTAIAVNNRFLFYATAYYGRRRLAELDVPLASWLLMEGPRNQAETAAPLTPAIGGRVLMVSYEGWRRDEMEADFASASGLEIGSVWLDRRHKRKIEMFVGEGFRPGPRDPVSGLPVSAPPGRPTPP